MSSSNNKGEVRFVFSKHVGVKDSKKAEVKAILEALRIFSHSFQESLIVESDSLNAISWVSSSNKGLLKIEIPSIFE